MIFNQFSRVKAVSLGFYLDPFILSEVCMSLVDISRRCDKVDIVDLFKKQSSKN